MKILVKSHRGARYFSFCVGDDSAEEAYRLRGSFEIEGERLNGLNDYFRALGRTFSS